MEMITDARLLTVKIVGAEAAELYDLRVRNHTLEMLGFEYVDYYHIVRNLIEEYRLLFIEWVAGFDKWNYIIDRWGPL